MLALFKFLAHLFSSSIQFLYNFILLQLIVFVCCASRISSHNHHKTAPRFLSLVEEKNPSERYETRSEIGHSFECCTVCLSMYEEGDEVRRLISCEHIFHKACLDTWLHQGLPTCPLCRSVVFPDRAVAKMVSRQIYRHDVNDESDEELENSLYACFAW